MHHYRVPVVASLAWLASRRRMSSAVRKLGEHHQGENHNEAIALVARVDKTAAKNLNVLLDLKTKSSYSPDLTSEADQKRAGRAAAALVSAAQSA